MMSRIEDSEFNDDFLDTFCESDKRTSDSPTKKQLKRLRRKLNDEAEEIEKQSLPKPVIKERTLSLKKKQRRDVDYLLKNKLITQDKADEIEEHRRSFDRHLRKLKKDRHWINNAFRAAKQKQRRQQESDKQRSIRLQKMRENAKKRALIKQADIDSLFQENENLKKELVQLRARDDII